MITFSFLTTNIKLVFCSHILSHFPLSPPTSDFDVLLISYFQFQAIIRFSFQQIISVCFKKTQYYKFLVNYHHLFRFKYVCILIYICVCERNGEYELISGFTTTASSSLCFPLCWDICLEPIGFCLCILSQVLSSENIYGKFTFESLHIEVFSFPLTAE